MKPLDFKKPFRFSESQNPVHYVGIDSDGNRVFQVPRTPTFVRTNDLGQSTRFQDIVNVPEKIVRWMCVLDPRYSVVQVEFEDEQRP